MPEVSEADLHAYVDGYLDFDRRAQVESYLAANPDARARAETYRAQNIGLHGLFDDDPHEVRGDSLRELASELDQVVRGRGAARRAWQITAMVGTLSAITAAWWAYEGGYGDGRPFDQFTRQATVAHNLFASDSVPFVRSEASSDADAVGWLSKRITGAPLPVPDLGQLGFSLVVERLLPSNSGPAVQLLYRDQNANQVTLYMGRGVRDHQTAYTFVRQDTFSVFYWQREGLAYSLVGEFDEAVLLPIATEINKQFSQERAPVVAVAVPDTGAQGEAGNTITEVNAPAQGGELKLEGAAEPVPMEPPAAGDADMELSTPPLVGDEELAMDPPLVAPVEPKPVPGDPEIVPPEPGEQQAVPDPEET